MSVNENPLPSINTFEPPFPIRVISPNVATLTALVPVAAP